MGRLDAPQPLETHLEPHRNTLVVAAAGEIDLATAGDLERQLRELLELGFERVVLDLRDVVLVDSTGLRTKLEVHAASRDAGTAPRMPSQPARSCPQSAARAISAEPPNR